MSFEEERLEAERERLYQELSRTGDFRRGSISATYRRCGKLNCVCAQPDDPGHGPRYLLTTKVNGKTYARKSGLAQRWKRLRMRWPITRNSGNWLKISLR
ncbi:MAG: DUF6788 family protein [Bacillota bacterium]